MRAPPRRRLSDRHLEIDALGEPRQRELGRPQGVRQIPSRTDIGARPWNQAPQCITKTEMPHRDATACWPWVSATEQPRRALPGKTDILNGSSGRSDENACVMSWSWAKRSFAGSSVPMPTITIAPVPILLLRKTPQSGRDFGIGAMGEVPHRHRDGCVDGRWLEEEPGGSQAGTATRHMVRRSAIASR
jgi:hypothetical protein